MIIPEQSLFLSDNALFISSNARQQEACLNPAAGPTGPNDGPHVAVQEVLVFRAGQKPSSALLGAIYLAKATLRKW
jgi:hypothetical protein